MDTRPASSKQLRPFPSMPSVPRRSVVLDRVAKLVKGEEVSSINPFISEMTIGGRSLEAPMLVMADSYKAAHFAMYPPATTMVAYGEFRKSMDGMDDDRIVVYGIRHYIEQFINRVISGSDIDAAVAFYSTHQAPFASAYPYPEAIFQYIRDNGHLPIKIEALPEGSVVYPHTPVYIITATGENSHFCTFLETLLTMIWYPSSVATLSRLTKSLIETAFSKSVDDTMMYLLDSRLHDFGFRGCTCVEQSVLGGTAHLLSFTGSDTMSACYHAQYHLNGGVAVGSSIPATEHSVMTSWKTEIEAIKNLITRFPGTEENPRMIACVMDSYDYDAALSGLLPRVLPLVIEKNCFLILRPDSGDPVKQVIKALKAAEKALLSLEDGGACVSINSKGFKMLKHVGVIQGDGINYEIISDILEAVMEAGYSAANVAFGMGGGLLQKVNRDTMSFATKLSYIKYAGAEGGEKDVMKRPATDRDKWSIPGKVRVLRKKIFDADGNKFLENEDGMIALGPHMVFTEKEGGRLIDAGTHVDSMKTVYDHGESVEYRFESFSNVKKRLNSEWSRYGSHVSALDSSVIVKQDRVAQSIKDDLQRRLKVESIFEIKPCNQYGLHSNTNPAPQSLATNLHRLNELLTRMS